MSIFKLGIRKKIFFTVIIGIALSIGITSVISYLRIYHRLLESTGEKISIIGEKTSQLVLDQIDKEVDFLKTIAFNTNIKADIRAANRRHEDLTLEQTGRSVSEIDQAWLYLQPEADPVVKELLSNPVSHFLQDFQSVVQDEVEIFITDRHGLNLAMTDRTTDYWQGDEEWWLSTIAGMDNIGSPIFDESSQHWAMIIAVPVTDNGPGSQPIGVVRGTVDITALFEDIFSIQFGRSGQGIFIGRDGNYYYKTEQGLRVEPIPSHYLSVISNTRSAWVEEAHDLDDQPSIMAVQELQAAHRSIGWVVVAVETSDLNGIILDALWENLLIGLALFTALGLTSLMISNSILTGIQQVKEEAHSLAVGDYSQSFSNQIQSSRDPDVRSLVESFNRMKMAVQTRENALQVSEKKYRTLVETMNEGLVMVDPLGRIQYTNPRLQEMTGASWQELIGKDFLSFFSKEEVECIREQWKRRIQGHQENYEANLVISSKDETLPVSISPQVLLDENGSFIGSLAVITDISTRKKIEIALNKKLRELAGLRNIDTAILEGNSLNDVIHAVLAQVREQLKAQAAALYIFHPDSLEVKISHGFLYGESLVIPSESIKQELIEKNSRLLHAATFQSNVDERLACRKFEGAGLSMLYVSPIFIGDQMKGLIEIGYLREFPVTQEWLGFFDALMDQAALGVEKIELVDNLQTRNLELQQAYQATIQGWARALELRDEETQGHSERVVTLAVELARRFGFQGTALDDFRMGALLHDIGKMGIPDSILLKPGPLDADEWETMKKHPVLSCELLSQIPFLRNAVDIPHRHHERWDGSGYPDGLRSTDIPLAARIFAVVDVWDALTSDRPYRPAWTPQKTRAYLLDNRQVQFDPWVVDEFLEMLASENRL